MDSDALKARLISRAPIQVQSDLLCYDFYLLILVLVLLYTAKPPVILLLLKNLALYQQ